jgi:biotin carboxyl carrier protein
MDFSDIERILALVKEHDLTEFELEREGLKLRVRKTGAAPTFHASPMPPMASMPMLPAPNPSGPAAVPPPVGGQAAPETGDDASAALAVVKSPIVGTF